MPVTAGIVSADGKIEIRSGLAAGDEVIVHSARQLKVDAHIKPVESLQ